MPLSAVVYSRAQLGIKAVKSGSLPAVWVIVFFIVPISLQRFTVPSM